MPERKQEHPDHNKGPMTDPVKQRVEAAVRSGDEMTIARINHLMRTDPLADFPGEEQGQLPENSPDGELNRLIPEGLSPTKAD